MPATRADPRPTLPVRGAAAVVALALSLACNKGPALEAIAAAEQALAAAPELAAYEPAELAATSQALREARASLDQGRYTDALRLAQGLEDRVAAAVQSAARRRQQAEGAWRALAEELPARLEPLRTRVEALEAAGVPPERLAAARAELTALDQALADAGAAAARGELLQAVAAGQAARTRAEALSGRLGLRPLVAAR